MDNVKNPVQPIYWDGYQPRFKENKIVTFLLEAGPFDMNQIAMMDFSDEDRSQFAQLIGYSTSGFGDLSYADLEVVAKADLIADVMRKAEREASN